MKDGVSVSRGSTSIPCCLIYSTICQFIAYAWCFFILPAAFIYKLVDGSTVPFVVLGSIVYMVAACTA